jgi:hypothetical protein
MTRYFFHLNNGKDVPDLLGQELSCIEAAKDEAMREARQMVAKALRKGRLDLSHRVIVTDQFDRVLFVIPIGLALGMSADAQAA